MLRFAMYFIAFLLSQASVRTANANYEMDYPAIRQFMYWVETDNREALSKHVEYPLHQPFKIPSIKDEAEFVSRFDEVFDEELMAAIANSSIEDDWGAVGWRGIMFGSGQVWLTYEGNLRGVNHTTKKTLALKEESFAAERKRLHPSLHQFIYPILEWKTKNYTIRIDEVQDHDYRYTSWSIDKKLSDEPDLVLYDGELHHQGSGGNHNYDFKNDDYIYRVDVNIMGKFGYEEYPGYLEVLKSDVKLLREDARARWSDGKYIPSDEYALRMYED